MSIFQFKDFLILLQDYLPIISLRNLSRTCKRTRVLLHSINKLLVQLTKINSTHDVVAKALEIPDLLTYLLPVFKKHSAHAEEFLHKYQHLVNDLQTARVFSKIFSGVKFTKSVYNIYIAYEFSEFLVHIYLLFERYMNKDPYMIIEYLRKYSNNENYQIFMSGRCLSHLPGSKEFIEKHTGLTAQYSTRFEDGVNITGRKLISAVRRKVPGAKFRKPEETQAYKYLTKVGDIPYNQHYYYFELFKLKFHGNYLELRDQCIKLDLDILGSNLKTNPILILLYRNMEVDTLRSVITQYQLFEVFHIDHPRIVRVLKKVINVDIARNLYDNIDLVYWKYHAKIVRVLNLHKFTKVITCNSYAHAAALWRSGYPKELIVCTHESTDVLRDIISFLKNCPK